MSLEKITCGSSTTNDLITTVNGLVDVAGSGNSEELEAAVEAAELAASQAADERSLAEEAKDSAEVFATSSSTSAQSSQNSSVASNDAKVLAEGYANSAAIDAQRAEDAADRAEAAGGGDIPDNVLLESDKVSSNSDATTDKLLITGSGGILGSSITITNPDDAPLGSNCNSGQMMHLDAVNAGFPDLGLGDTVPVWWELVTSGGFNNRVRQEATQIFNSGGTSRNSKFTRVKQGISWSTWELSLKVLDVGTASFADLVTDLTDTTIGRVTTVGDFGIGNNAPPFTDWNAIPAFYAGAFYTDSDAENKPEGLPENRAFTTVIFGRGTTRMGLCYTVETVPRVYNVKYVNGVWSVMGQTITDDNIDNYVSGTTVVTSLSQLQAALDTRDPVVEIGEGDFVIPSGAQYTVYSNQTLKGAGIDKTILKIHPDHPENTSIFINGEISSTSGDRLDENNTISDLTIYGGDWEGYLPWLTDSSGNPVTDPEADYEVGGIIGDGGDIFDVVAAGRRNADYRNGVSIMTFDKARKPVIERVRFDSCSYFGIVDRGCLSMRVRHCEFINHGKVDDISSPVWTQAFGTPQGGDAFYAPSEDHVTEHCYFECKRSAITLSSAKGGAFRFNTIEYTGESAVFCGNWANVDGGRIDIHNNKFGKSVITDLVVSHVETNGADNVYVYNNEFNDCEGHSLSLMAGDNVQVYNNTFKDNVVAGVTRKYGPFSERYSYGVGSAPIAGELITNQPILQIGSYPSEGANNNKFYNNRVVDTRTTSPLVSVVFLSRGQLNVTSNVVIEGNDVSGIVDTSVKLVDSLNDVMEPDMTITTRNNVGTVDMSPVIVNITTTTTGVVSIDCGFCPSIVDVYATTVSNTGQSWSGKIIHSLTGGEAGARLGSQTGLYEDVVASVVNNTGATAMTMLLDKWTLSGFDVSVSTITQNCEVTFICHP